MEYLEQDQHRDYDLSTDKEKARPALIDGKKGCVS